MWGGLPAAQKACTWYEDTPTNASLNQGLPGDDPIHDSHSDDDSLNGSSACDDPIHGSQSDDDSMNGSSIRDDPIYGSKWDDDSMNGSSIRDDPIHGHQSDDESLNSSPAGADAMNDSNKKFSTAKNRAASHTEQEAGEKGYLTLLGVPVEFLIKDSKSYVETDAAFSLGGLRECLIKNTYSRFGTTLIKIGLSEPQKCYIMGERNTRPYIWIRALHCLLSSTKAGDK